MPPTRAYNSKPARRAQTTAKELGHRLRWEGRKQAEGYCTRLGCNAKVLIKEGEDPVGSAIVEKCGGHK